jgi:tetratricopeptide (TPR) repeat protein
VTGVLTNEALTGADLDRVRETALGEADPLGAAAGLAEAAAAGRLADKADAGYALTIAAEIAESKHKYEAALTYVERAVEAYGTQDDTRVTAAHAVRARILFRAGRGDDAMAELEPLRPALTKYPDAAAYVSSALLVGKRARVAEQWLTEAVKEATAERTSDPASADEAGTLFFLLQQRHRIRHALDLPHDSHDNLADRLETRLANATSAAAREELVFWPEKEFEKVSAATDAYGTTWDEHRAQVETALVRRGPGAVPTGSFAALERHGDPAKAETRSAYAKVVAGGVSWPPERNGACWCGSGGKYKKCCLPRSR